MAEGWIKLHRKIQDCDIWLDDEPFDLRSAWVDLLLLANHRDKDIVLDYKPFVIKRGQFLTSVRKLSVRWGWSKDKTLKYLRLLESLGMIERDSNNQRTLLTIVKYRDYQVGQDTDATRNGHETDANQDTSPDTGSPQTRNIKNEKNIKKYIFVPPTIEEVRNYCQERNNSVDPVTFVNFYESKGWMIGKNKMKDWKSAVRTWERNDKDKVKNEKPKFDNYNQRTYDYDALLKDIT